MTTTTRPESLPPEPTESHTTVAAEDGTRLFLRTMPRLNEATSGRAVSNVRVIFCDGILCDGFIWKYLWNDLAQVADVAHWHYRGHGRSGAPRDPAKVDIAQHARDLQSVREHLGNEPCVLVGHSMGTQVALEHYRRWPEGVRGIVLICGSYGKVTQTFRGVPILDNILPRMMDVVEKQPDLARALWTRLPPEMAFRMALLLGDVDKNNVRREDMIPYLRHMTHVDFPMFLKMLRSAGEHSAEEWLGEVKCPALVVAGERDTFTPASLSTFMSEAMPNSELLMVPGGTHVAPIEQPDLIGSKIKALIERVST